MKDSKVSFRYASSLLDNAVEKNNIEAVAADMELVSGSLKQSRELKLMLKSPVIKSEIKCSALVEIFKDKINSDTLHFLKFVIEKNREMILEDIVSMFLELKDQHLGILQVEVATAVEFTAQQEEELRKNLESQYNKKIKFTFRIEPSVIGGFVVRVADTLYDASLKHQLEILKKQFLSGSASLN